MYSNYWFLVILPVLITGEISWHVHLNIIFVAIYRDKDTL